MKTTYKGVTAQADAYARAGREDPLAGALEDRAFRREGGR